MATAQVSVSDHALGEVRGGTMRAAMFYGPEDVRIETVPIPTPGPEEILVKVGAATTCGTDVKTYSRGYSRMAVPSPFGHEYAGQIVAMGDRVPEIRPDLHLGARVVPANSAPDYSDVYARRNLPSLSPTLHLNWGAFAEYVLVPALITRYNTYLIPDNLSDRDACLTEPFACVLHGIEESNIRLGDTVVINGAGPIGLMYVALAKHKGARIISTDLNADRLQTARSLGAHETIQITSMPAAVQAVKDLTGGHGAEVVIEAVGLSEVWEASVEMARKGGTVNLFGGPKSGTNFSVDTNRLHYDMLTLKAVFHHTPHYFERALKLIEIGLISSQQFVNRDYPLEQVVEAIQAHRRQEFIKAAILP